VRNQITKPSGQSTYVSLVICTDVPEEDLIGRVAGELAG